MITAEQIVKGKTIAENASLLYFNNTLKGVDAYACGFAWVEVRVDRTNSKQAQELIKAGFRKDYKPKCLSMWNPGGLGVQNIDCKEEGAIAMAAYLQALGLSAYSASRLD